MKLQLETYTTGKSLSKTGRSVYESIPFLQKVSDFMENPVTRGFYDEYMNRTTLKSTLFFMWVYSQIEEHVGVPISQMEKVALLHQILHKQELHQQLLHNFECDKPITHNFSRIGIEK